LPLSGSFLHPNGILSALPLRSEWNY
jgi:hypothetical protein